MADEMLPEVKVGGLPEFPRRTLFHALNSRAMVRRYARSVGKTNKEVTVIVAHMGGGSSVSLHRNGLVIDTNDALGGDGPISPERAGSVPGFPLVEMCFSGEYTKDQVKKKLVGRGGAVAYFGTNDIREIIARAESGDEACETFLKGFSVSVAKYVGALATVVGGKVDAIVLTGGIAHAKSIVEDIRSRVEFIAPVEVYAGENELESLAENGYGILAGEFDIKYYHPDHF
jgi:butyrate kinase